jgi:protein-tyrosine-phosphatase
MPAIGPVLVVCTANICRSPMGAALLRHALAGEPEPLRSVPVISAGVSARGGEAMTGHSVTALKKVGIAAGRHSSQPVTQAMLDQASLVLCMTESHRAMIEATAHPAPPHLYLFRELMEPEDRTEIADPYGGPYSGYELSRDEMVEAIPSLLAFLRTQVDPAGRA